MGSTITAYVVHTEYHGCACPWHQYFFVKWYPLLSPFFTHSLHTDRPFWEFTPHINASTMTTMNPFHQPSLHNSTWAFLVTSVAHLQWFDPFVSGAAEIVIILHWFVQCQCCDDICVGWSTVLSTWFLNIVFHTSLMFQRERTPYSFAVLSSRTEYEIAFSNSSVFHTTSHLRHISSLTSFRNATSYLERYSCPQHGALHAESHPGWI